MQDSIRTRFKEQEGELHTSGEIVFSPLDDILRRLELGTYNCQATPMFPLYCELLD